MYHLIVTEPFGSHAKGERILDPEIVAALLANFGAHVVKVSGPADELRAAPEPPPAPRPVPEPPAPPHPAPTPEPRPGGQAE